MSARRIVLYFLAFGILWILGSDRLLALITSDVATLSALQSVKGLAFVGLSALLILFLGRLAERRHQRLQDETNRQRERLAHILEVTPAVLYTLKPHPTEAGRWEVDFVSQNVEDMTGHPPDVWRTRQDFWQRHLHPEDLPRVLEAQARLAGCDTLHHEYRICHADGSYRWVDDRLRLLRDADGRPLMLTGAWLDITDRKRAEQAIQASENRYHELFEVNPLPMWVFDLGTLRFMAVNEAAVAKYGYSREEFLAMTIEDIRPPEDVERLRHTVSGHRQIGGYGSSGEWQHVRKDGTRFWVEITGHTLLRDGRPARLVLAQDITDRRQAEERSRLISQVFEATEEGIFITDAQNRFVSVNRAFSRITGYSPQEVLGQTPALLKSERQNRAFYAELWKQLNTEGRWEGEIWNRNKSGEVYPEWLAVNAIKDEQGRLQQYLGIFTETSSRKSAEERILRLANHDSLTDLPNRALLVDRARVVLATARHQHTPVVLMHLNLDHFSAINESLGHEAGDQVLRELALRLTRCLEPEDTLCRLGGDDFILLLPDTGVGDVAQISVRLMDAVARPFAVAGQDLRLSASIGAAEFPENGSDLTELSRAAESAVHLAKREGRNTVRVASRRLQEQVQETLALARELRWAVERGELVLHYQAQMDARSERVVGLEALVRWQHPQRGLVPPGRFIPIAEETGLIREIGRWVLDEALRQTAAWRATGLCVVPVAINLSVSQFRDPGLPEEVAQALRRHDLPAHLLELELTESVAMEDSDFTIARIASLKQLGVTLSIDDFGTGYSSLSYLKRFTVDKLKIDQSFVRGLAQSPQDEAIVATVINLARSLGLHTVAEGVETAEQLEFLRRHGCNEIQGYHFHRPAPAEAVAGLLSSETL
ncbi:sensor domain-containing protein [Ideonella dechloratans]|uniref:sensor domain-containing protein n=1 Tax=Ideonella dechloratans TaxID=36863 RepID=UPI0035AF810F